MILTNIVTTAYCACQICCGPNASGLAANGKSPIEGITVAGPRRLPFGTTVTIPGLGIRIIHDRLAKRYDARFDVYFKNHSDAKKFGIKTNNVTIIKLK